MSDTSPAEATPLPGHPEHGEEEEGEGEKDVGGTLSSTKTTKKGERKGTMRGGHDPAELGRRSGAARRGEGPKATDTSDSAIVAKLRNKAAKGDIAAARELREWQAIDPDSDQAGDEWLSLLTTRERGIVRDLLRHVRARKLGQAEGEWPLPVEATEALPSAATGSRPSALPSVTTEEGAQAAGEDGGSPVG